MNSSKTSEKKDRKLIVIHILLALLLILCLNYLFPAFFDNWENKFHDALFILRNSISVHPPVTPYLSLVVPDDRFLESRGLNYLDRSMIFRLIAQCAAQGAKVIGADFIIYDQNYNHANPANNFVTPVSDNSNADVYYPLYVKKTDKNLDAKNAETPASFFWNIKVIEPGQLPQADRIYAPQNTIIKNCTIAGHINLAPDYDGINRRLPLFYQVKGKYLPAFALVLVCKFLEVKPQAVELYAGRYVKLSQAHLPGGTVKDIEIPVDLQGQLLLNYITKWNDSFDLIDPEWLLQAGPNSIYESYARKMSQDMLILIGDATTTGKDFTANVFDPVYPAAGIIATAINSIINSQFITSPTLPIKALAWIILIIIVFLLADFFDTVRFALLMLLLIFIYNLLCIFLFLLAGILPYFLFPQFFLWSSLISITIYKQFRADKRTALEIIRKMDENNEMLYAAVQQTHDSFTGVTPVTDSSNNPRNEIFNRRCREYGISVREKEIIRLTHDGFESKEIAYKLDISPRTVGNHLANIYRKAKIRNKIEISKSFFFE